MNESKLVIRPSPFNQPYMWVVYLLAAAVWLGCVYLVTHPPAPDASFMTQRLVVGCYAALAVIPVGIAIGLVSTRTASIYLTAAHIGHTGIRGIPVEHERTALARIVLFSERRYQSIRTPDGVLMPVIAFESRSGGELFRVSSRWWRLAEIRRLSLACGVPIEGSWEDIRNRH